MNEAFVTAVGVALFVLIVIQLWRRRSKEPTSRKEVRAPVDLDKPVENPKLVALLDAHARNPSLEARTALAAQLNKAVFLLPIMTDEAQIARSETDPGQATFEKGSLLKVFGTTDAEGNPLLPIFTDWPSIRAWISEDVSTLVLPAQDAWSFATMGDTYSGAVINPGGHDFELGRPELEELKTE